MYLNIICYLPNFARNLAKAPCLIALGQLATISVNALAIAKASCQIAVQQ